MQNPVTKMSSNPSPPPPPISKLHSDLLWHIFSLNADMELDSEVYTPALDTLRNTSQVCSSWRDLAVESSALWGRVINVACFVRRKARYMEEWGTEVMKRTGNSALDIKATLEMPIDESVVESLLKANWSRIRSLDLKFYLTPLYEDNWSSIFQRPAAMLETFRIDCEEYDSNTESTASPSSHLVLFGNNAPSLRRVSATNLALDLTKTPWASNLRHIVLSSAIPVCQILHSLFLVPFPFLESLELDESGNVTNDEHGNSQISLHPISLPCLQSINLDIWQQADIVLSMLTHITPSEVCALRFFCRDSFAESSTLEAFPKVLSKYLRYTPELASAFVVLTREHITFRLYGRAPTFSLELRLGGDWHAHIIPLFLSGLTHSAVRFDKIKTVQLHVDDEEVLLADASMDEFICSLTSVEHLETGNQTLKYLDMFQKKGVYPFASLKTIGLFDPGDVEIIGRFLESRTTAGLPAVAIT